MNKKNYDLEDRLVAFSSLVIDIVEALPGTKAGNHIGSQLIRCGLSAALLYGEAQSAESREDFIHKMKIGAKELKETRICLKIIRKRNLIENLQHLENTYKEDEELIAIFSKSISTAKKNKAARLTH